MKKKTKKVKKVQGINIKPLTGKLEMVFPPRIQVEITASYGQKVNKGNYESADYFRSRKQVCNPEDADKVSEELNRWCKREVEMDIIGRGKSAGELKEITTDEAQHDAGQNDFGQN